MIRFSFAMMLLLAFLAFFAATAAAAAACKCTSQTAACWPTSFQWSLFNRSIGGQLVAPLPPAHPCYVNRNSAACQSIAQNWSNPFWRADQPGAMQYPFREAISPVESCPLIITNSSSASAGGCHLGAISPYAVRALDSSHVQSAVRFAALHNLRLSIKTTGHDNMGRSASPGSLNIWLHYLRDITFHDSPFIPAGCPRSAIDDASSGAVTVGAGVQWRDLYRAADSHRVVVVGAMSASVSAAGGYLQGGGHSPLSPLLGLAADNVLELSVVTSDGGLVTASACQNKELFWALRGGGGGTYGVVVSATLRTFPALRGMVRVSIQVVSSDGAAFEELLTEFVSLQARLSDEGKGWAGYSYIRRAAQAEGGYTLGVEFVLPNSTSVSTAAEEFESGLGSVIRRYEAEAKMRMGVWLVTEAATFEQWHDSVLCGINPNTCSDATGTSATLASTLVAADVMRRRPADVARALLDVLSATEIAAIVGHLVGGGAVARGDSKLNSVNPAWRRSIWHVVLEAPLGGRNDSQVFEAATRMNGRFRSVVNAGGAPAGAYLNEANPREPEWQHVFFGAENYGNLLAIKRAVDPHNLFTCTHCVGSEFEPPPTACSSRN